MSVSVESLAQSLRIDYIDYEDRTSYLTHNNGTQLVSFSIPNVPKAASYDIVAKNITDRICVMEPINVIIEGK